MERLALACSSWCETKVIAPVPWFPALPGLASYSRYSKIPRIEQRSGLDVLHPRFILPPGMLLHRWEAAGYYTGVKRHVSQLRKEFPFDLIHAHFIYPDGAAATRLGNEIGVPVVITEHASWSPWLNDHANVRKAALNAASKADTMIAVSTSLGRSMESFGVPREKIAVIPNVVDETIFTTDGRPADGPLRRLLFVGIMRKVKGLDILFRALRILIDQGVDAELAIVGESFYPSYARDLRELRELAETLRLGSKVTFLGGRQAGEVAAEMRQSSVVVLPSRRETFGVVLAESLACGTPVVATRCGGPEDIVGPEDGVLVEPENPSALAAGIAKVLAERQSYEPRALRARCVERFGTAAVSDQVRHVYETAMAGFQ